MSTDYQGQTTEQIIAGFDQPYSSPYVSFAGKEERRHFCLSDFYAHAHVLASIVPLDLLKVIREDLLDAFMDTPEMSGLATRIHQHLGLPAHHSIRWVCYRPQRDDWQWHLYIRCDEPPYPELGWDAARYAEGIYQLWRVITQHVCHSERVEK